MAILERRQVPSAAENDSATGRKFPTDASQFSGVNVYGTATTVHGPPVTRGK